MLYQYTVGNAPVLTLDIRNLGPDDATGVIINYKIGNGLKYEAYSIPTGTATYNSLTNTITWIIGNMPSGGHVNGKIFVKLLKSDPTTLTTSATLVNVDQNDSNTTNNNATCQLTSFTSADIGVNQTQTTYTQNGINYIQYTITTTNNGPDSATNVKITDKLPTGLTYISSTASTGTYSSSTGVWNIGTLNYGDTPQTLIITAKITGTGTIKNTVTKTTETEYDPNPNNNAQTLMLIIP